VADASDMGSYGSVLLRVKPALAWFKKAVGVIVLAGTNDCLANSNASAWTLLRLTSNTQMRVGPQDFLLVSGNHTRAPAP
jgi:hypothetical protein